MPASSDPYAYPGSSVLRNLADLRNAEGLAAFEANAVWARLIQLEASPLPGRFDTAHLKAIHRHIFQDVYDWAGQFRTVDLSKDGHLFARPPYIESALRDLFRQLAGENFLKRATVEDFAERAGFYLTEMNAVHPFREGNGRTQREFLRELAGQAGFAVDWRRVTRDEMTAASRESFATGDSASVVAIMRSCVG
jgi:cell filamentation protein